MFTVNEDLDNAAVYWLSIRAAGTEIYCIPVRVRDYIFAFGYATQKYGEAFKLTKRGHAFLTVQANKQLDS
jgi:hypothetical protein